MIILEFTTITIALVLEAITLQLGSTKTLTDWLKAGIKPGNVSRIFLALIFCVGSILYLLFAISWALSPSLPVQVPGLVLLGLSLVSSFGFRIAVKEKPVWFVQLDSSISMACIMIVALARIKGF